MKVGAFYEPNTLPDYSGSPCFELNEKKLTQVDIRRPNGTLVEPRDYLFDLRPGTLVMAKCTLHRFDMPPNPGFRRGRRVSTAF